MKTTTLLLALLSTLALVWNSCKKDDPTSEDDAIFQMIQNEALQYYQSNDTVLNNAGNSPHGTFKLLFNQTAWAALGTDGKLPAGASFPEGSFILKDVTRSGSTSFYAAMWKKPNSGNATEGWLWYEAKLDGSLIVGVSTKGDGCIGCHRGNTHRDFTNSFDLH
ncbi:hypothetical protein BH09BAC1_BH09BAC1_30550 [soil metagenome]